MLSGNIENTYICKFYLLKVFDVFFRNDFENSENDHDDRGDHNEDDEKHVFYAKFDAVVEEIQNGD